VSLAVWLLALPFRAAGWLGPRRTLLVGLWLVALVVGLGMAEDLGLIRLGSAPARPASTRPIGPAAATIPRDYRALYQRAARRCPGLPWEVLAAVGRVESNHGRARLPGVRSGANWASAAGPMQFGIGGKAGNTWGGRPVQPTRTRPERGYGVDGNRDGRVSVYDPADAIPAAADYLCANGAPRHLRRALFAYNHSPAYVRHVMAVARRYATPRRGGL
jgi:peptidoglycan DL-endopeptidase CwlO